MTTQIKICGITRLEDALAAIEAGANTLGFVFYPPSPRAITPEAAAAIIHQLPPFITCVGLFVNPTQTEVESCLATAQIDLLQFHGDETADFCQSFNRPYIKALRMRPDFDPLSVADDWKTARGILLDAYTQGIYGGTGEVFDWARFPAPNSGNTYWILAGGLTPNNVKQAIQTTQAYAVDVSGGVESARGIKCPAKIQAFTQAIQEIRGI